MSIIYYSVVFYVVSKEIYLQSRSGKEIITTRLKPSQHIAATNTVTSWTIKRAEVLAFLIKMPWLVLQIVLCYQSNVS